MDLKHKLAIDAAPPAPGFADFSAALALLAALVGLVLLIARPAAEATVRLDISLPWGAQEFHSRNAIRFAQAVETASAGRLRIGVHPGAALGIKGPDSLRAARDGVVAMVEMATFQQVGEEPLLGLDALPFLVRDQAELALLYEELRPAVEAAFARHGLAILYMVPWPPQNLYTKRAVEQPRDLAGLVVRSLDANTTTLARRLGMVPVQLASPDVVPALAAGALDAVMTSTTTGAAQNYPEFLSYLHRTNHGWITNFMVIGKAAAARLAPGDRALLFDAARALEAEFWRASSADDLEKLRQLEARGMIVIEPDAGMVAAMEAIARPMWRDFAARLPEAAPLIDRFLVRTGRAGLDAEKGS